MHDYANKPRVNVTIAAYKANVRRYGSAPEVVETVVLPTDCCCPLWVEELPDEPPGFCGLVGSCAFSGGDGLSTVGYAQDCSQYGYGSFKHLWIGMTSNAS